MAFCADVTFPEAELAPRRRQYPRYTLRSLAYVKLDQGNGGIVRYVQLPYEAHGYLARESTEHTLWEMVSWFDKWVKNAQPAANHTAKSGGE